MSPVGRGADWGTTAPVPDLAVWVTSDGEARSVVTEARRRGEPPPPLVLLGGDLARTLGGSGDRCRLERGEGTTVEVDLGAALIDGRLHWFLAHLVARRSWVRGRIVLVANAAFIKRWNVAPRAHPGDGRLDIVDGSMRLLDRVRASRRLASGLHLPHPELDTRRVGAAQFDLDPALDVRLDGQLVGRAANLSVRVEPAAVRVWV